MSNRRRALLASAVLTAARFPVPALGAGVDYHLELITPTLNQPTYLSQAPGDPSNVLYYSTRITSALSGFSVVNTMGGIYRYTMNGSTSTATEVLDLSSRNITNDDGLQTFAFNPDFNNATASGYGKIYVSDATQGATSLDKVEEFTLLNPDGSFKTTAQVLATDRLILQYSNSAQNNHTVDWVGFDPNAAGAARNYLYISTGDGSFGNAYNGASGVNGRPSQNPSDDKGKLLRVDISGPNFYDGTHTVNGVLLPNDPTRDFAIPASNPLVVYNAAHPLAPVTGPGGAAVNNEVFATGIRNGYRMSFDTANSNIYFGDVGENTTEEVNILKAGANAGGPPVDFGWPQREGLNYSGVSGAPTTNINPFTGVTSQNPIQTFIHTPGGIGFAAIGGYVYHGPVASLQGQYFYGDFVNGRIWSMNFDPNTDPTTFNGHNGTASEVDPLWNALITNALSANPTSYVSDVNIATQNGINQVVSFGTDNAGNLYVIDFGAGNSFNGEYTANAGAIYKVVPGALTEPATAVWSGGLDNNWSSLSGTATNFNTDRSSGINTNQIPGYSTDVVFATTTPGAANFSTVLNRDMFINSLTIKAGTPAVSINNGTSGTATLVILGTTGVTVEAGSSGLTIGSNLELGTNQAWVNNATASNSLLINGTVMGPGGIALTGTLTIGSGSLNFTGPLSFAAGTSSKLLLGGSSTTANQSTVGTLSGDGTAIIQNSTSTTATNTLQIFSSDTSTFGGIIRDGTTGRVGLLVSDGGMFIPTGTVTTTGPVIVRDGAMVFSGAQNSVGGTAPVVVGDTANFAAVLEVNGSSISGINTTGTAGVLIGTNASQGAVILNSGSISATGEFWVCTANGGYGALIVNGGALTTSSWLAVARGGGDAIVNVNGGTLNVNGNPLTVGSIGGGSNILHAVATFTGGTVNVAKTMFISEQTPAIVTLSGNAIINVNGTSSINTGVGVAFTGSAAGSGDIGILNLNGGTLTTTEVMKGAGTSSGLVGILNFNGGTLRAGVGTPFTGTFIGGLNNAYVWPGGASIDDNGQTITVSQPLLAPSGSGVSSIVLPGGAGYFAPPMVTLTGGGGTGATAIANVDTSGNLTGITITNPGVGYTAAPTVALFGGGGYTTGTSNTVLLATNLAGGLTKVGAGTLNLTGLATYGGPATINAGLLVFNTNSTSPNTIGVVSGAGSLQVDAGSVVVSHGVQLGGSWTINGQHTIGAASPAALSVAPTLTLAGAASAWTGRLDLTNSNLIVSNGGTVANQIKQAASLGAWNGAGGITSSSAQAAATSSTPTALAYALGAEYSAASGATAFFGHSFAPTDTLVMYTLAGDANMDGAVTFADFLALQNHYNQAGDWAQGDWNYDGQVTFADFLILQNNYNKALPASPIQPAASGATAAPEPASLLVLAWAAIPFMRKRSAARADRNDRYAGRGNPAPRPST